MKKKKKENETRQSKIRQNKKQTQSVGVSNPTPERVPKEQMIALLIFGVSFWQVTYARWNWQLK